MFPFFLKFFNRKERSAKTFIKNVTKMSFLSEEIKSKVNELNNIEYAVLLEDKDNVYISLSDFIDIIKVSNIKIEDVISKFKHITELKTDHSSTIELYAIPEDDHIVLCPDIKECDRHKDYKGEKTKITSIRR
jgi:hypothetical protein